MQKLFTLKWVRGEEYIIEDTDIGYISVAETAGGTFSGQINGVLLPVGTGLTISPKDG